MERYGAYKDSGVAWIGEIPEEWEICPIWALSSYNDESLAEDTDPGYQFDYIDISSVSEGSIDSSSRQTFESAPSRARRIIRRSDVLVSTVRTYLKAIALVDEGHDGDIASTGFCVLRPRESTCSRWFGYAVSEETVVNEVVARSVGVSYPAINASDLVKLQLCRPPVEEQRAIADYLDAKTAEVDALVADCEREVGLLREYRKAVVSEAVTKGLDPDVPMKDSGVELIGKIPEGWGFPRLGMLLEGMKDGTHSTHQRVTDGHPLLSAKNVRETSILITDHESMINDEDYKSIVACGFPKLGDVLLTTIGGSIGRAVVYDLEVMHAFQRSVMFLRPKKKLLDSRYLCYMLRANLMQTQMFERAAASAQDGIYSGDIARYRAVLPPFKEQVLIANYLDAKTGEIDALIEAKQQMADKLREYRKSLISEAVTGKFKVPGVS